MEIREKIENKVNELVELELERAKEEHGEKFNSNWEAYAVLKEEIEEAAEDLKDINENLDIFWEGIRLNRDRHKAVLKMEYIAKLLIQEAAQISAMALKYKNTFKEKPIIKYTSLEIELIKELKYEPGQINPSVYTKGYKIKFIEEAEPYYTQEIITIDYKITNDDKLITDDFIFIKVLT